MRTILLSIFGFFMVMGVQAQSIRGKLTDSKSEPLIGATIIVEGTKSGAQSDLNGDFVINGLNPGKYRLRFQYVGMKNEFKNVELAAGQNLVLNLTLKIDENQLDEAVVVGYGTQTKREITTISIIDKDIPIDKAKSTTFAITIIFNKLVKKFIIDKINNKSK